MTSDKQFKEWTLYEAGNGDPVYVSGPEIDVNDKVKVIEYAAYDQLRIDCQKLVKALELMKRIEFDNGDSLHELERRALIAKEALNQFKAKYGEVHVIEIKALIDEREKSKKLIAALNKIAMAGSSELAYTKEFTELVNQTARQALEEYENNNLQK